MQQQLPFAAKWTITEGELISMKESENGRLSSTYVTTGSEIQYCLSIFPYGNRKENRGQVFVFLVLKIGSIKEVAVKLCTVKVESANNFSREIDHTFKESRGWGKYFCDTADLFDSRKGFIHDGKLVLKIDGLFVFKDDQVCYNPPCKTNLGNELWANEASKDLQIFVDGKMIKIHKLILAIESPVFNELLKSKKVQKNQLIISGCSFHIVEWALREIYGLNYSTQNGTIYDNTISLIEFYDKFGIPSLKDKYVNVLLQLNGKHVPKLMYTVNGSTVTISYPITSSLGAKLWANEESKDYKIMVDGKTLLVHELILATQSPKFAAMLASKSAESVKNQIEIDGFSFYVVELAMKWVYKICHVDNITINDAMAILEFFYKYDFLSAKNEFEGLVICYVHAASVCHLTNCAMITNSTKLQKKCMEFLMNAYKSNTPLYDIENLDKYVALKIIQKSGHRVLDKDVALIMLQESNYQIIYTRKADTLKICSILK